MSRAWWIAPCGEHLEVATSHIDVILQQPARFGLTRALIEAVYAAHDEKIGVEGRAREILVLDAIGRGWIRIREYEQYWKINAPLLDGRVEERLRQWVDAYADAEGPQMLRLETPVGIRELPVADLRRAPRRRRKKHNP